MKIGIDATVLQIKGHRVRGIGRYARSLLPHLFRADPQSEFILFFDGDQKFDFSVDAKNVSLRPLKSSVYPLLRKRFFKQHFFYPCKFAFSKVDVIHFPTHLNAAAFQPSRSVVGVMDAIPYVFPEHYFKNMSRRQKIYEKFSMFSVKNADAVITISEASQRDITKHFRVKPEKVRVVHLAASEVFKSLDRQQALRFVLEKYDISGSFVLYVGGFDFRKNVLGLIEVFEELKQRYKIEQKLVIVGSLHASEEFVSIMRRVVHHKLSSQVILTDFVPDEDLVYFYNAASVFVFPTIYEGFGLPILEAMACGLPVVSYNNSCIPEIAGDSAILVENQNPEKLGESIIGVLGDPSLHEELSQNGLEQARKFSWEKTARETLEVYKEVARMQ